MNLEKHAGRKISINIKLNEHFWDSLISFKQTFLHDYLEHSSEVFYT